MAPTLASPLLAPKRQSIVHAKSALSPKLLTALFTGAMVCATSFCVYSQTVTDYFPAKFMVLGLVCALIVSHLDVPLAFEWSFKTTIASWLGCAVGCAAVAFVTAVNGGVYNPYIGVAVALPFCFLLSLAEQSQVVFCKLSSIYRGDKALLLVLIPVAFGGDAPYHAAITASVAYTIGSAIPLTCTLILWKLDLLPSTGPPPLPAFSHAVAEYFSEVTSMTAISEGQTKELRHLWTSLYAAHDTAVKTHDLKLRGLVYSMLASLSTLRHTPKLRTYSAQAMDTLWAPLKGSLDTLRVEVVSRLNDWDDYREGKADLAELALVVQEAIKTATEKHDEAVGSGGAAALSAAEIARFEFAATEIVKFALLSKEFVERVRAPAAPGTFPEVAWDLAVAWWKQPMFAPQSPPTPWRIRLAFPLRASIGVCVAAWAILIIGETWDFVHDFGLWMILPCVFCFLPTPGASLRKGSKRILGTLLASVLGVVCVSVHPHNNEAFFVELFVISALGKRMFADPSIHYAGLVFGFTWQIVGLAPGIDVTIPIDDKVSRCAHRMILTTAGVTLAVILSTVIYPIFAYSSLQRATARSLGLMADLVASALEGIAGEEAGREEALAESVLTAGRKLVKADGERWAQVDDARVETKVMVLTNDLAAHEKHICAKHVIASQHLLDRLSRRTLVVVSTAATCGSALNASDEPLPTEALLSLARSLRESSMELVSMMLDHRRPKSMDFDSVVGELKRVEALLHSARKVSVSGRSLSNLSKSLSFTVDTGAGHIDHILYALGVFVDAWEDVEHMMCLGKTRQSPTIPHSVFSRGPNTPIKVSGRGAV